MTEEVITGGMLRVVSNTGNTTEVYVVNGQGAFQGLRDAVERFYEAGHPHIYSIVGRNDAGMDIPVVFILEDISLIFLLPPPSNIARPGIAIVDPNRKLS